MVDLSTALVMWVITFNTKDFPDKHVARRRYVKDGQQYIAVAPTAVVDTLEQAREGIFDEVRKGQRISVDSLILCPRHPEDDPVIVETWL